MNSKQQLAQALSNMSVHEIVEFLREIKCSESDIGEAANQLVGYTLRHSNDVSDDEMAEAFSKVPTEVRVEVAYKDEDKAPYPNVPGKWYGHKGGPMPVNGKQLVEVMFPDGGGDMKMAGNLRWTHIGSDGDIVAYQLLEKTS